MSGIVADVKRAIVETCMRSGIEEKWEILALTAQAINGIGSSTVAAYKAHATMRNDKKIAYRKAVNKAVLRKAGIVSYRCF